MTLTKGCHKSLYDPSNQVIMCTAFTQINPAALISFTRGRVAFNRGHFNSVAPLIKNYKKRIPQKIKNKLKQVNAHDAPLTLNI